VPESPTPQRTFGAGLAYAIAAYGLWGILPLYFLVLEPSGAIEIVAWRILFSLVFCALLLTVMRGGWKRLAVIVRNRRTMLLLAAAGTFIVVNWVVYVFATLTGHVVEASLGYFINPIVTVLLGVIVLRERLRPLQWIAIGVSAVAVLVLAIGYGAVPWIALVLAFSFGLYGLLKKAVGGTVDAVSGLTVETALLSPAALIAVVWLGATGALTIGANGGLHTTLLLFAGVITAVPLLFFAAGARRLPLTVIGLTQYLAPILQLLVGVFISGEAMPLERWIGFGIVWIALAVLTADMFLHGTRQRAAARAASAGAA
jgi:chloramphenicol-sensitive protein RarD